MVIGVIEEFNLIHNINGSSRSPFRAHNHVHRTKITQVRAAAAGDNRDGSIDGQILGIMPLRSIYVIIREVNEIISREGYHIKILNVAPL